MDLDHIRCDALMGILEEDPSLSAHIFLRHGFSLGNLVGLTTGSSRLPLTADGSESTIRFGRRTKALFGLGGWEVKSSAMYRSVQTISLLMGDDKSAISRDARLNETNGGICADIPRRWFDLLFPTHFAPSESPSKKYPKGESHNEMLLRVKDFTDEHCDSRRLFCCTHHGVLAAVIYWSANEQLPNRMEQIPFNHNIDHLGGLVALGPKGTGLKEKTLMLMDW